MFCKSLAPRNANGMRGAVRRHDRSGSECLPALGEDFRTHVPLLTESPQKPLQELAFTELSHRCQVGW